MNAKTEQIIAQRLVLRRLRARLMRCHEGNEEPLKDLIKGKHYSRAGDRQQFGYGISWSIGELDGLVSELRGKRKKLTAKKAGAGK